MSALLMTQKGSDKDPNKVLTSPPIVERTIATDEEGGITIRASGYQLGSGERGFVTAIFIIASMLPKFEDGCNSNGEAGSWCENLETDGWQDFEEEAVMEG
eukprot:15361156-Ditylum_brightwellii.AAC.1